MKPSAVVLPEFVQDTIAREMRSKNFKDVQASCADLSSKYQNRTGSYFSSTEHRLAYLTARAPSTFGAIKNVFEKIKYDGGFSEIHSFLDAGSGPGCGLWAAIEEFDNLQQATLIEKDKSIAEIGKSIIKASNFSEIDFIQWELTSLESFNSKLKLHDFVLASYSLGEIPSYLDVAESLWDITQKWLVIIEPGDRLGFERIKKIRTSLIAKGAKVAAPCPHDNNCPLPENDWCHFSQKIIRSNHHKKLKIGTLPYEEEKFSYVAFTRLNPIERAARVIKRPKKGSGHILLDLCLPENIERKTISKKEREKYRLAKKLSWGDDWKFT
jgi:ribosomal protein RSM22 (predicted rRNA methylase)